MRRARRTPKDPPDRPAPEHAIDVSEPAWAAAPAAEPARLRLPVPFYRQRCAFTCGPAALMMALKFFEPGWHLDRALELELWRESTLIFMTTGIGGCGPMGLAAAAASRGLAARVVLERAATPFITSVRSPTKRDVIEICHQALRRRARGLGVKVAIAGFGFSAVKGFLDAGALPIVLVSLRVAPRHVEPHWVLVTGYEGDHVLVHDPWVPPGAPTARSRHRKIPRDEFRVLRRYGADVRTSMVVVAPRGLERMLDRQMRMLRTDGGGSRRGTRRKP